MALSGSDVVGSIAISGRYGFFAATRLASPCNSSPIASEHATRTAAGLNCAMAFAASAQLLSRTGNSLASSSAFAKEGRESAETTMIGPCWDIYKLGSTPSVRRARILIWPVLMARQRSARGGPLERVGPVAKGFDHQRVKSEFVERRASPGVVRRASCKPMTAQAVGQRRQQRTVAKPPGPFLQLPRQEAVAPDGHDAGRRRGDADRSRRAVKPCGVFGVDEIARLLRYQRVAWRERGSVGRGRDHRATQRQRSLRGEKDFAGNRGAGNVVRDTLLARQDGGGGPIPGVRGAEKSGFTEQVDVCQCRLFDGPGLARCDLLRGAPKTDDPAQGGQARCHVESGQAQRQLSRRDQGVARLVSGLPLERLAVEWMMQRQRAAGSQPERQGRAQPRERSGGERRHQVGALRDVAFKREGEPAGDQMQMGSRYRAKAVRGYIKGDDRGLAAVLHDRTGGGGLLGECKVQRGHAFGQIGAEPANMANGKRLGGGIHCEVGLVDAVDLAGGDDGARAGAIERDGQLRLPQ